MARALLIHTDDLKQFSVVSGNMDEDKLIAWIEVAQDTHIKQYLGTDLLARLEAGVIADDLTASETSLINDYVKKMLVHWTLVVFLPHATYDISNRGIFKPTSETGQNVDTTDVNWLIEFHRNIAQDYTSQFIDYMCYNQSTFPQYSSNTGADQNPNKDANFSGWVL